IAIAVQLAMIGVLAIGFQLRWPLVALAAIVMSPPFVAGLLQWIVGLTTGILPRPTPAVFDPGVLGHLLGAGVAFMALDLAAIALLQGGPLVLGHVVSPEAVVPYGA